MITLKEAAQLITSETTLVWLRRDLRLQDNAALYHALKNNREVLPLFIFDTQILDHLDDKKDCRVDFIHTALFQLHEELKQLGSSLLVLYGDPVTIYERLSPKSVYANHDFEPYAIARDENVKVLLEKRGIAFYTSKDHVIFEKSEVVKEDGKPYTVFTPYSRKWKAKLNAFYLKSYPVDKYKQSFKRISPLPMPSLAAIGFEKSDKVFPERIIRQSTIVHYDKTRDLPGIAGTTRLSVHLRFGTVSIRQLARMAKQKNEVWLNELIWRDFYQMILWHFPQVVGHAFKPAYDRILWRNNEKEFEKWCQGATGYPIVDAGMRELNATGFMHNRVRMIVASFLTKHLLIDWRWGEAYFAKRLLDYDLAANNGGWQWAAGSGCDAAPYFRVLNPALQTEKFDPEWTYIRKWVPEVDSETYARPIIDHKIARERVLKVYKAALNGEM